MKTFKDISVDFNEFTFEALTLFRTMVSHGTCGVLRLARLHGQIGLLQLFDNSVSQHIWEVFNIHTWQMEMIKEISVDLNNFTLEASIIGGHD